MTTKALVIAPDEARVRVAGLTVLDRMLRSLRDAGVGDVVVVGPGAGAAPGPPDVAVTRVDRVSRVRATLVQPFLLLVADRLIDPRILSGLIAADPDAQLVAAVDGGADVGAYRCTRAALPHVDEPDELVAAARSAGAARFDVAEIDAYVSGLRKSVRPWWAPVHNDADAARAKRLLIANASKGASDVLARYIHMPIENAIVLRIADAPVTPNQLTIGVNVLAYVVTALYALGLYLPAVVLAFVVGVADGLDGKLARVTGRTSRLGSTEHSFDLLFEFSWLLALGASVTYRTGNVGALLAAGVAIVLIAFYRHMYDGYRRAAGRSLDDSGGFERVFRRVAGRRNLFNLPILVAVLLDRPAWALWAIVAWAALTALVYAWRAMRHLAALDRSRGAAM